MADKRLAIATLTALAVFGATASAGADNVTVEFDVNANSGGLTVASASGTQDAGGATYSGVGTVAVDSDMPNLQIDDTRGLLTTWTVSVVAAANFDDGADVTANDGTNSIAASNAVVYLPFANIAAVIADAGTSTTLMTLSTCHCAATGATALLTADLGTSYTLMTGIATNLVGSPSATVQPDFHVTVPTGSAPATYKARVTYTVS